METCDISDCKFVHPHVHTGTMVKIPFEEYWCPTLWRWVSCPGPCLDGREHYFFRKIERLVEKIKVSNL